MKTVNVICFLIIASLVNPLCVLGQHSQQLDIEGHSNAMPHNVTRQNYQIDIQYQNLIHKAEELGSPQKPHSSIFDFCAQGDTASVSNYLANGGNPNLAMQHTKYHYGLLDSAIIAGQVDVVKLLLKHGADVNTVIGGVAPPLSLSLELLQLAKNKRDIERIERLSSIVDLIRAYGAVETGPAP
mgnify:CR=1 FL=1